MTSFATRSEEALKRFLRTAVVVDDHISFKNNNEDKVVNKESNTPSRGSTAASGITQEPPAEYQNRELDGTTLVNEFLNQGVMCTLLERKEIPNIDQLLMADILILDWKYGDNDNGECTLKWIKAYTYKHPCAIHFICIYTSDDIKNVYNKFEEMKEDDPTICNISIEEDIIKINNTYIAVLQKNSNSDGKKVNEKNLPQKLIEIFSSSIKGLLINTVLHSIGEIRDNTYALLSRFQASLDPAFLTHRAYSNPCEDTEKHIIPLICSEINSILLQSDVSKNLNLESILLWVEENEQDKNVIKISDYEDNKRRHIRAFLEFGFETFKNISEYKSFCRDISNGVAYKSNFTKFWGSKNPQMADAELAMLMSYEYNYKDNLPILQAGTVVKNKDTEKYYICLQPPCDCVRIQGERCFIFAPLDKVNVEKKFDFVSIENGNLIYLKKDKKVYNLKMIKFSPKDEDKYISSYRDNDTFYFESDDHEIYIFILQLKEVQTLRTIRDSSEELSRIGLMESDWLRRCNLKTDGC